MTIGSNFKFHCDKRYFSFCWQVRKRLKRVVFRHRSNMGGNMRHTTDRFRPQTLDYWPCDLLIGMANARQIGNGIRLNSNGISVGIIGILGM